MSEIKYNKKEKILSMRFSKNKSVDSEIKDNVVIDYDKNGKVVNIDVMEINLNNFVSLNKANLFSIQIEGITLPKHLLVS